MNAGKAPGIEFGLDVAASALFAAAAGLAVAKAVTLPFAAGTAIAGFAVCFTILRRVAAEEAEFILPAFPVEQPAFEEMDELVLTEADRLLEELILTEADRLRQEECGDELVLEDVLASLGPDARVVRLFDPAAMPTPGELSVRIDRHLNGRDPLRSPPDASQALHQALADLRRSLN